MEFPGISTTVTSLLAHAGVAEKDVTTEQQCNSLEGTWGWDGGVDEGKANLRQLETFLFAAADEKINFQSLTTI